MNNEQKVIAMLERIVAGDLTGIDTGLGLCVQASSVQLWAGCRSYTFIDIQKYFSSWEHYSGHGGFPIKSPWYSIESPSRYYRKQSNKYQGRQLLMRQSLAKHLIKCIKENTVT